DTARTIRPPSRNSTSSLLIRTSLFLISWIRTSQPCTSWPHLNPSTPSSNRSPQIGVIFFFRQGEPQFIPHLANVRHQPLFQGLPSAGQPRFHSSQRDLQ